MADLLIHSVSEFSELILEALTLADARNVVEIGAEYGGMSALLAEHCRTREGLFTTIDPAPKREFRDWLSANPDVRHLAKTSLDAFGELGEADAWIVDGDHNWYTVYHELRQIEAISRRDGNRFWSFFTMSDGRAGAATPITRPNKFLRSTGIPIASTRAQSWIRQPW